MAKRNKNRNKNRRRVKRTKYLSLTSLNFPPHSQNVVESIPLPPTPATIHHHHHDESNMEYLLSSASDDGDASTTLTALLLDSSSSAADLPVVVPDHRADRQLSVSYVSEAMNLVRTALRSRERDSTPHHQVERYVRYSQVVDDRRDHEEVTSSRVGAGNFMLIRRRRLALKLDYQQIMNAWSDKGAFYVSPSLFPPQTVPDVTLPPPVTYGGGLWSVPEGNVGPMSMFKMKEEETEEEEEEVARVPQDELEQHRVLAGQREASVLRYKEKRRNRLFSKTIRYQVRKENAQKRPRVKGRFVKRT